MQHVKPDLPYINLCNITLREGLVKNSDVASQGKGQNVKEFLALLYVVISFLHSVPLNFHHFRFA
jgi:hypothetical protein